MSSSSLAIRIVLLGAMALGVSAAACQRSGGSRTVVIDSSDDTALERVLREIIAANRNVTVDSIDMKRPISEPPLHADGPDLGNILVRVQQRLDFFFTEDELEKMSKGSSGRGPRDVTPEWILKFTKQALTRTKSGQ
jgi:hypothetical protein